MDKYLEDRGKIVEGLRGQIGRSQGLAAETTAAAENLKEGALSRQISMLENQNGELACKIDTLINIARVLGGELPPTTKTEERAIDITCQLDRFESALSFYHSNLVTLHEVISFLEERV